MPGVPKALFGSRDKKGATEGGSASSFAPQLHVLTLSHTWQTAHGQFVLCQKTYCELAVARLFGARSANVVPSVGYVSGDGDKSPTSRANGAKAVPLQRCDSLKTQRSIPAAVTV
eukprot:3749812-Amphidinium_carterae.1